MLTTQSRYAGYYTPALTEKCTRCHFGGGLAFPKEGRIPYKASQAILMIGETQTEHTTEALSFSGGIIDVDELVFGSQIR